MSLAPSFWMFYPLMAFAGLGNGVFHPADLWALSHHVSKGRLGRAYSVHGAAGRAGFAAGPAVMGVLAVALGWREALAIAGVMGWIMALVFFRFTHPLRIEHLGEHHAAQVKISYRQLITTPVILLAFGYFLFTTAAGSGFQAFASVSFVSFFHITLPAAATALSIYLLSSGGGMLIGGVIADRTTQHVRVAVSGLVLCASGMLILMTNALPFAALMPVIIAAGIGEGITAPSRDILIKGSAPKGAVGRVFGFVYSGVDTGATVGPLVFGALVDAAQWHALFLTIAVFYIAGIPFVIPIGKRQQPKTA